MHILADEGNTYTRARFNVGPGSEKRLRCRTTFDCEFPAADHEAWCQEYWQNVTRYEPFSTGLRDNLLDESGWWHQASTAANWRSAELMEVDN